VTGWLYSTEAQLIKSSNTIYKSTLDCDAIYDEVKTVNIDGDVIGVNAAISTPNQGNVGIGFAIPVDMVRKVANDLMQHGEVVRAYLGILPQEITSDLRKSLDLEDVSGVLIAKVEDDTPASDGKLEQGDVIIKFDNREIADVAHFRIIVAESEIGIKLPVEIVRKQKHKTMYVTLMKRPADLAESNISTPNADWLGLKVESVNSDAAKQYKIDESSGVFISAIEKDSPAEDSELRVGDVILEINFETVEDVENFNEIYEKVKEDGKDQLLFRVKSLNGQYHYVAVNTNR